MNALHALIIEEIDKNGAMRFDRFMDLCLNHRDYGYYQTRDPFGEGGDFTTAPEVSQMFGELIGLWLYQQGAAQGLTPLTPAELGPGRGVMMADMLRAMASVAPVASIKASTDASEASVAPKPQIHLVEASPILRDAQHKTLKNAPYWHSIDWHFSVATLPEQPLLLVANEFFDALPIRRFIAQNGHWHELTINHNDGVLLESPQSTPTPDPLPFDTAEGVADGTITEFSPTAHNIATHLAQHIAGAGGVALIIDYGNEAQRDSLQAIRHHRPQNYLGTPGELDLTAWVDFRIFTHAAEAAGITALGPVGQGEFLKSIGLYERSEKLAKNATPKHRRELLSQIDRLTSPAQMGEVFKVLALLPKGAEGLL